MSKYAVYIQVTSLHRVEVEADCEEDAEEFSAYEDLDVAFDTCIEPYYDRVVYRVDAIAAASSGDTTVTGTTTQTT